MSEWYCIMLCYAEPVVVDHGGFADLLVGNHDVLC